MRPAVTVVIPTKDRFGLLRTTLASVLAQSGVDVRVVVVEDGGADGTAGRLSGVDPRVRAVRHPRSLGVARARNTGLAQVDTPWVAFVDDDDLWAPGKLSRQLAAVADDPACRWACSTAVFFTPAGLLLELHEVPAGRDLSVELLRINVVPGGGSGVLADTALVREVGGFDPELANLADWDCWLRLAQRSPVARVAQADVAYRRHGAGMAHAVGRSEAELGRLRDKHADLYRAAGVDVDWASWREYLQDLSYGGGRWAEGVRRSVQLHRDHGRRRMLLRPLEKASPALDRRLAARRFALDAAPVHAAVSAWLVPALAGG